jgi:hypothetical protein
VELEDVGRLLEGRARAQPGRGRARHHAPISTERAQRYTRS